MRLRPSHTDLPPHSLACALGLVDAVRCRSRKAVAHALRQADQHDGLEALAVTLAALVDDQRPLTELLAWNDRDDRDVTAWRNALTNEDCRDYHAAYTAGKRDPEVADGEREYQKRRMQKSRRVRAAQLRKEAA